MAFRAGRKGDAVLALHASSSQYEEYWPDCEWQFIWLWFDQHKFMSDADVFSDRIVNYWKISYARRALA